MKYNDYELVILAQDHNEEAKKILYNKYYPLIEKKAWDVYRNSLNKGVELEDIIQEELIGFEEAIKDFKQDNDTLFYTFLNVCVDRQLSTLIAKINRNKHKPLNEAVSIDEDEDDKSLLNIFFVDDNNPEKKIVKEEEEEELLMTIKSHLTSYEEEVFELKLQGYSYTEIASILDKDNKAIDNAIQRIRNKIKEIIK